MTEPTAEREIPTNPMTGEPYFEITDWSNEGWQAGEVQRIPELTVDIDPNYKIVAGSLNVQES